MQPLIIAILSGIGGMIGWGFADFSAKKTVDNVGSIASLVWAHIFGTLILVFFVIYSIFILKMQLSVPVGIITWIDLMFFGSLQTVIYLLLYKGFEKGKVSLLNPIFSTYSGFVALISILFLGEIEIVSHLFGLVAIFIGIILLNIDLSSLRAKQIKFSRINGFKEVITAAILAIFWTLGWDKFINGKDWLTYALFMYAFMALSATIYAMLKKADLTVTKYSVWKFLFLIGLGEAVAYVSISLGFSLTPYTSVVAVLSGASSLITVILARIFIKEKMSTIQGVGTSIIITGVAILSI